MSLRTLLTFLVGRRDAILTIASTPARLWLGLLFVLSAGFAREYDGRDLLAEPWHLLVPVAASLGTSFLLFAMVYRVAAARGAKPPRFLSAYRSFLALYWMTAPLAWLYAIPVERFLSAGDAMRANLWLLAIVALWRMALMVRVVSVMFEASVLAAFWPVLLFADSVVAIVLFATPIPVFNIMGGVRLSEREEIILTTALFAQVISILTWPIWALGTAIEALRGQKWRYVLTELTPQGRVRSSLWALAACAILVWLPILRWTQPEQQLRHRVETEFAERRIEDAIGLMRAHGRDEFPPHWDPPPNVGYGEEGPVPLLDVLELVTADPTTPMWVQEAYAAKLTNQLSGWSWFDRHRHDLQRLLEILKRMPDGREILATEADQLYRQKEFWQTQYPDEPELREQADQLLQWIDYHPPEPRSAKRTRADALGRSGHDCEAQSLPRSWQRLDAADPVQSLASYAACFFVTDTRKASFNARQHPPRRFVEKA